ncbi:MAG: RluA family pseudouridine synthase [Xanthomonadaceae bacterium]|nr:RluA family pseudouridine synthase [Xanthomonadaceae bacterium]
MDSLNNPGSVRELTVDSDHSGQRLDNFLTREIGPVPRALVYRLIRTGQVRINGGRAKPMRKLSAGDRVRIPPVRTEPQRPRQLPAEMIERVCASVVHRQAELLVIDKPAGLAVQGGSGLKFGLNDLVAEIEPGAVPVHRLDRDTSGLIVFALGRRNASELQRVFRGDEVNGGRIEKRYFALLEGHLTGQRVDVDLPILKIRDSSGQHRVVVSDQGSRARSSFKLLERLARYDFVEVRIDTGRTHQIRVHAQSLGSPVVADSRYNPERPPTGLGRMFLHAGYLRLPWPEDQVFSAPLPEPLTAVLDRLRCASQ